MAGFKVEQFKGIRPRVSSRKLPLGEAQTAENCKLGSGDIVPWDDKDAGVATDKKWYTRSIYRFDNAGSPVWFEWDSEVDVARGPIKGDTLERTYFTGDGVPKMTFTTIADGGGGGPYPEDDRDLGIPAPPNPLAISDVALPENVPASSRTFTSIQCEAFIIDEVFVTASGTGTADDEWIADTLSVTTDPPITWSLIIAFEVGNDKRFRVKRIVDDTTVVLESADTPGIFAREDAVGYSGADGQFLNAQKAVPMKDTGDGEKAGWSGWTIPEATVTFPGDHHFLEGDVIRLASASEQDSTMKFVVNDGVVLYEQSWPAYSLEPSDSTGLTQNLVRNVRVAAATVEGDAQFNITGTFIYSIDREASKSNDVQDRTYVYTYVSDIGEEGPPSPVSAAAFSLDGNTVLLRGFENVFTSPALDNRVIEFFRLYRTNATAAGTEFQFVREISVGTTAAPTQEVADNVDSSALGEVLATATWFPPASDMQGILTMPNGMVVGFSGKNVYMCEPGFPHAWPPEYDQAVEYDVVGLANFGNTLVVLTKGFPYLASGSHPRQINLRPAKANFPCSNKKSIASGDDQVFYSSPDGLVSISNAGIRLASDAFAQKDEWQTFSPSTMVGAVHDGKYFGFFDGLANVEQPPATIALTGTFASAETTETDIQAGGKTIIITITGTLTWEDAGATFDATRQAIIDSFVSEGSEANGWNAERANIAVTDVVRTSATVVTITLPALGNYEISADETIEASFPPGVFKATEPDDDIQADNDLEIVTDDNFSSRAVYFGAGSSGDGTTMLLGYSTGDADQWAEKTALDDRGSDTLLPTNLFQFLDLAVYDSVRQTWLVVARGPQPLTKPILYTSVDGLTWAPRESFDSVASSLGTSAVPPHLAYYPEYDLLLASWANTHASGAFAAAYSKDGGSTWNGIQVDTINQWDATAGEAGFAFLAGEIFSGAVKTTGDAPKFIAAKAAAPGNKWTPEAVDLPEASPTGLLDSVAAGNGKVIYAWVNGSSDVEISYYAPIDDSHTEIGTLSGFTANEAKVVYGNGKFMIITDSAQISTVDANGDEETAGNWTAVTSPFPAATNIQNLYFDPGNGETAGWGWVACGYNTSSSKGVIFTSDDDGVSWTLRYTTASDAIIHSMAFSNFIRDSERR